MPFLTNEPDSVEREAMRREREAYLDDWSVEQPQVGLGRTERRCGVCGSAWVDVGGGIEGCAKDRAHAEMVEEIIEPVAAEPVRDPRSPHRMNFRPWRRSAAPETVGPDAGAKEALRALDEAVSTVLVAIGGADQACRASTSQLEAEATSAAARGESPTKREWRPGFKKAAATLRTAMETTGDVSPDSEDLPRLRQTLLALQLTVRQAAEEEAEAPL